MPNLKYVRLATGALPVLLVFPAVMTHAEAAAGRKVLSAGFVDPNTWSCFGESLSLQLASCPEDTVLLRAMIGANRAEKLCDTCNRWDSSLVDGMCQECRMRYQANEAGHGGACCGSCANGCGKTHHQHLEALA